MDPIILLFSSLLAAGSGQSFEPVLNSDLPATLSECDDGTFERADLYDLDAEIAYGLYRSNGQYFVVDDESGGIYETLSENPYKSEDGIKIYNKCFPTEKFLLGKEDGIYFADAPNLSLSDSACDELSFGEVHRIDKACDVPSNAVKIPNYEYFINLKSNHAENVNGTCSIVSISMLLGYYDTFVSDAYVPETYDYVSTDSISPKSWKDWTQSPGTGVIENGLVRGDSRFHDYLYDIFKNNYDSNKNDSGILANEAKLTLEKHLSNVGVEYSLNFVDSNPMEVIGDRSKAAIKQAIDEGRPVIANGKKHSTVAFAYDDDYLYIHTGWGYAGRKEWDAFTYVGDWYIPSCIDLIPKDQTHSHCNNYYSLSDSKFYCSCGLSMYGKELSIPGLKLGSNQTGSCYVGNKQFNVNFQNASKGRSNFILDASEGNASITFSTGENASIFGVYLEATSSFLGVDLPKYLIDWCDWRGNWHSEYDAGNYTSLYFEQEGKKAINVKNAVKFRIRVEHNAISAPKLTVRKLVFAIC